MELNGRTIIYTNAVEVTEQNVLKVLEKALAVHRKNSGEIEYLFNYYRGKQPILNRVKEIRPEINNKIVENHASEIVAFKVGYVFGEPVQYVRRGEGDELSERIRQLNEMMFSEDKASQDRELAEDFTVCGVGYRMVLPRKEPGECPFEMDVLDPRFTFLVYSNSFGKPPIMGVKYIKTDDGNLYSIYTKDWYFEVLETKITRSEPHALGAIPIIEYPANASRMGAFEVVLPLLDALNEVTSNRLDGIEQFIQSFVTFTNCDISEEDFIALRQLGALKVKGEPSNPAKVEIMSQELNQTQTQTLVDYLYQMVLTICGMPNRNGGSSTSDTGAAVLLRDGWSSAEARARDTELVFKRSEKRFLGLVLRIALDISHLNLRLFDIDVKFTRRQNDNLLVKSQGLQNLLEAGLDPLNAISAVGLFNDPTDVCMASAEYLAKWKITQNKAVEEVKDENTGDNQDRRGGLLSEER